MARKLKTVYIHIPRRASMASQGLEKLLSRTNAPSVLAAHRDTTQTLYSQAFYLLANRPRSHPLAGQNLPKRIQAIPFEQHLHLTTHCLSQRTSSHNALHHTTRLFPTHVREAFVLVPVNSRAHKQNLKPQGDATPERQTTKIFQK